MTPLGDGLTPIGEGAFPALTANQGGLKNVFSSQHESAGHERPEESGAGLDGVWKVGHATFDGFENRERR
jgi:hypothetical protein